MFKQCIKRKMIITSLALILLIITLTFPKTEDNLENITITYQKGNTSPLYLMNEDNLVARTNIPLKNEDVLEQAKEIITYLTINSSKANYLPIYFKAILPSKTKLLSIALQEDVLKLNFNKNLLDVDKKDSEKMLECLVFSLTEIKGIRGILIYVENELLDKIPHTNKALPYILTRDIGVNKIYNLTSLKNVSKTTTYYIAKEDENIYYIPVTILENNDKSKIEIVIEHLKSSPLTETNLISYLNASMELSNYEVLEQTVYLSFSPFLYEGIKEDDILETVKYAISLSMQDTLNVQNVVFTEE